MAAADRLFLAAASSGIVEGLLTYCFQYRFCGGPHVCYPDRCALPSIFHRLRRRDRHQLSTRQRAYFSELSDQWSSGLGQVEGRTSNLSFRGLAHPALYVRARRLQDDCSSSSLSRDPKGTPVIDRQRTITRYEARAVQRSIVSP